jgi:hypothetical protein
MRSEGRLGDGFDRLDQLKWIHEIPGLEREGRLAADYVDAVKRGKTALVVSPTHAEGVRILHEDDVNSALSRPSAAARNTASASLALGAADGKSGWNVGDSGPE